MTLQKWFSALPEISFEENILSQTVRFPRFNVFQHIRQSEGEQFGFTLTVEHLREVQRIADPNQFLHDLHRGGCRIVYLNRRDVLRHAIATLKTYSLSCQFGPEVDIGSCRNGKLTVDVSELLACLKYLDHQRVEVSAILHDVPHLELTYEDDLMDPNSYTFTADRLGRYLEIENLSPVGAGIKLVHQQLQDIVENYDEVYEKLSQSEYAYLLTSNRHLLTI